MRIINNIARALLILCLPVLLLTASIALAFNSQWLYQYGFDKYDISQATGLAQSELDKAASDLVRYFNSGEEFISITVNKDNSPLELFNEREVIHLRDVKGLIWLDYWALLGTLLYALAYAGINLFLNKNWRKLAWGLVGGSGLTLGLILLLGLGMLLNFNRLFLLFHLISFSNEFWMLDPTRDYLIMLFPGGFWYDAAMFCALATLGLAVITGGVAGGFLFATRKHTAAT